MAIKRLLRETRTVLLVPVADVLGVPHLISGPAATPVATPFSAPTVAALNFWLGVTNPTQAGGSVGGNVSGALRDNLSLGLASSETEQNLLITSVGNEVDIKFPAVNAVLEAFRDVNDLDAGVWNLTWNLLRSRGIRYAAVDRVQGGKKSTTAFAIGDVVSLYELKTDVPVDNQGDQQYVSFSQNFKPTGLVNPEFSLTA